jgi:hypothetical protein
MMMIHRKRSLVGLRALGHGAKKWALRGAGTSASLPYSALKPQLCRPDASSWGSSLCGLAAGQPTSSPKLPAAPSGPRESMARGTTTAALLAGATLGCARVLLEVFRPAPTRSIARSNRARSPVRRKTRMAAGRSQQSDAEAHIVAAHSPTRLSAPRFQS